MSGDKKRRARACVPALTFEQRILYGAEVDGRHDLADELALLVDRELAVRLKRIRVRGSLEPTRMAGLTRKQAAILGALLGEGSMTVRELEADMARAAPGVGFVDWSRSGLYQALSILRRRGYVWSDDLPRDGVKPRTCWHLTSSGEDAMIHYLDAFEALGDDPVLAREDEE